MASLINKNILVMRANVRTPQGVYSNISYWEPGAPLDPNEDGLWHGQAVGFFEEFAPLYALLLAEECSFSSVELTFYNDDNGVWEGASTNTEEEGTDDLAAEEARLPDQDALIIQRRTNKVGRANRGRMFVSGIKELAVDGATLITSPLAGPDYKQFARDLASAYGSDKTIGGKTWHARHWNRKDDVMRVITHCRAMLHLGSRRDRARNLGRNIPA